MDNDVSAGVLDLITSNFLRTCNHVKGKRPEEVIPRRHFGRSGKAICHSLLVPRSFPFISVSTCVGPLSPWHSDVCSPMGNVLLLCGATHLKQKEASLFRRWGCGVQKGRVRGPAWIRAGRQTRFPPSAALPCSFPGAATPAAGICEPHEKQHVNCCGL